MVTPEIVESDSLELEPAGDHTLFEVRDPLDRLQAAKRVAGALKDEIEAAGMVQRIGGREFVRVEGWQTLATMAGLTTRIVWSRSCIDGWEARAEVITADGRVVSSGEGMCTRAERNWARRAEYALRSMAQTRAVSRALRVVLGFVMVLSGHDATPAEEIDAQMVGPEPEPARLPGWAEPVADVKPVAHALITILKTAGVPEPEKTAGQIGQRIFDRCEDTIPVCVLAALEIIIDGALRSEAS